MHHGPALTTGLGVVWCARNLLPNMAIGGRDGSIVVPRAPKPCNEPGCPNLVRDPARRYCDEHYRPWDGHKRHKGIAHRAMRENTKAHKDFKQKVLKDAEYRCAAPYPAVCTGLATEVDRIDNTGGYTDDNCQALCHACHVKKSSNEGHQAQGHSV